MGKPTDVERRRLVARKWLEAKADGGDQGTFCRQYGIGRETLRRWVRELQDSERPGQ